MCLEGNDLFVVAVTGNYIWRKVCQYLSALFWKGFLLLKLKAMVQHEVKLMELK